jgi:tRNA pseudouridine38-40 synthase
VDVCRLFRDGPLAVFDVISRAFLHSQVRIMMGTLVEVGKGRLVPDDIERILASGDRNEAGPTAPPNGLILWSVKYPQGM